MKAKFTGPNGEFQSTHQLEPGTVTIGYLEELLEWLFYHNNLTDDEKLEKILNIEGMIRELLKDSFAPADVEYTPTWSTKLKKLPK
jgi:hypothetical protein